MDNQRNKRLKVVRKSVAKWRTSEATLLQEMAGLLPFPADVTAGMDKPTILRLSNAFINLKQLEKGGAIDRPWKGREACVEVTGGFFLTLDGSGLILEVSPQVQDILGYKPHELIGFSILDFLHPGDHVQVSKKIEPPVTPNLSTAVEFLARLKFKTIGKNNKTKHTGFMGTQVRGCLKMITAASNKPVWLFIGACYPLHVDPCFSIKTYDASFCFKVGTKGRFHDASYRYTVFNYMDLYPRKEDTAMFKAMIPKQHVPFVVTIFKLLGTRGSVDMIATHVTRSKNLIKWRNRMEAVFGPKGEVDCLVLQLYALRKEPFMKKLSWPDNNLLRMCIEHYGVPGEDFYSTGAEMDSILSEENMANFMIDPIRFFNSVLCKADFVETYTTSFGSHHKNGCKQHQKGFKVQRCDSDAQEQRSGNAVLRNGKNCKPDEAQQESNLFDILFETRLGDRTDNKDGNSEVQLENPFEVNQIPSFVNEQQLKDTLNGFVVSLDPIEQDARNNDCNILFGADGGFHTHDILSEGNWDSVSSFSPSIHMNGSFNESDVNMSETKSDPSNSLPLSPATDNSATSSPIPDVSTALDEAIHICNELQASFEGNGSCFELSDVFSNEQTIQPCLDDQVQELPLFSLDQELPHLSFDGELPHLSLDLELIDPLVIPTKSTTMDSTCTVSSQPLTNPLDAVYEFPQSHITFDDVLLNGTISQ